MRLTYFGHSAFQLETGEHTLLFDPFITGNKWTEGVIRPDGLEPDFIILTHAHEDHWGDTVDIAERTGAQVVCSWEIMKYLHRVHGYDNVQPLNVGGSWRFPWGSLRATHARHSSSFPDGTYGGVALGYLLYLEGKTLYNTGDTDYFYEMHEIADRENIDLALMPIGDCFTMGIEESVRVAGILKPRLTVPLHFGTFPYIEVDTDDWVRKMERAGLVPKLLGPGETLEY